MMIKWKVKSSNRRVLKRSLDEFVLACANDFANMGNFKLPRGIPKKVEKAVKKMLSNVAFTVRHEEEKDGFLVIAETSAPVPQQIAKPIQLMVTADMQSDIKKFCGDVQISRV